MNVSLHIISLSAKGVQCVTLGSTDAGFWLPRRHVTWSEPPEAGAKVSAEVPTWLAQKHKQLVAVRGQYAFPLTPLPGLDPERATQDGSFPMSDYPQDAGKGALYRNTKAEKPSHPSHTGFCDIDGRRYRIAAWVRTKEDTGEKYFSLTFRPADEQPAKPAQRSSSDPTFDDQIPF
jgi:hypothetical protein